MDDDDDQTYLLLLLSDSNLPTGSFVASSGFESYIKHGFGGASDDIRTTSFMSDSISAYARSALPFVSDVHRVVTTGEDATIDVDDDVEGPSNSERYLQKIQDLDDLYDVMTLNHVTRRASKSQGVALLTLYSKGFSESPYSSTSTLPSLVTNYKTLVRAKRAPGHLPICWGILTGVLGLSLERSLYLHIFLHARSLLSASVRLNEIGPYNAQQLLLHVSRGIIKTEVERCMNLRTGLNLRTGINPSMCMNPHSEHQGYPHSEGPANTWPLGEILAARHDLQHSRIFNS
ncbi:hypothetical protein EV359DRAFT_48624 [Lentinula novae-zelandiae]|nr:hypothetical protein EV359DRAFT_48624 [Lentinula novae-zelandiae]